MTPTMKLWTLAAALLAISASTFADGIGRSAAHSQNHLCGGEPVKAEIFEQIAKKCQYVQPKGRSVLKCPAACVQQSVGWLGADLEPISDVEDVVSNLVKSGAHTPKNARIVAEAGLGANCAAKLAGGHDCNAYLDFGDCLIDATLPACGHTKAEYTKWNKEHIAQEG